MESTKKQKAALEKRLEEAEDIDTDSDEDEGGGKKAGGGASKMLGMFGAKAGAGGKISGLNRWTGLKKGLFSVRSFRKQKMTAQIRLKAICIAAAYYVLLFQHQPASVKTFNMFKCQKIEDTYFLRPDFRLTCFPLNGYHAFAGAIMAVFVFGFPAGTFYALYKKRNHLADPITMAQIGFLYFPYRPHGESLLFVILAQFTLARFVCYRISLSLLKIYLPFSSSFPLSSLPLYLFYFSLSPFSLSLSLSQCINITQRSGGKQRISCTKCS
jgi:hypothetical protein